jgi:hypothetical protein
LYHVPARSRALSRLLNNHKFGLLLALVAFFSMWFYVQRVLIPYQQADAAAHAQPRGILSDLYPRWVGARELLLHRVNPYSPEVTREIQRGYYGRELEPTRTTDPKDEERFAYPVYVVFLLAPAVALPFPVVRAGFNVLLVLLTVFSVPLWMKSLRWKPPYLIIAIWILLAMGSFPAAQGLKLQQLSLLVAGLLSAAAAAIASGFLLTGGVLLALATIKPQLVWLPALALLLWTLRDWRHRQRLAWAFIVTMLLLMGASQWILPGWIADFADAIRAYHQYTQNVSTLGLLLSPPVGNVLGILLIGLTLWLAWPAMEKSRSAESFGNALAMIMALTVLIAPMFAPYNQVLLLPAAMVLARYFEEMWNGKLTCALLILAGLSLAWPWVASFGLMLSSAMLPRAAVQGEWNLPLYTSLIIPITVFAAIAAELWRNKKGIDALLPVQEGTTLQDGHKRNGADLPRPNEQRILLSRFFCRQRAQRPPVISRRSQNLHLFPVVTQLFAAVQAYHVGSSHRCRRAAPGSLPNG